MKKLFVALTLLAAMSSLTANAQQSKQFDDYTVHYNALNSSLISPEAAKAYGIRRSDSRALINISVLKNMENQSPAAAKSHGHRFRSQPDGANPRGGDEGDR